KLHAEQPYLQLVASLRGKAVPVVTGVGSRRDAWRIRIAMAEAEHRGSWIAVDPGEVVAGMRHLHASQTGWEEACAKLRAAGQSHPALLAAWLDLDPERIERAVSHVNPVVSEPAFVGEVIEQAAAIRAVVMRAIESELESTQSLIESLIADGELDDARALADEWWRWTKVHDPAHSQLADSWRRHLSTMKSEARASIASGSLAADDADWALLDRWAAGDRAAGSALVDRYYRQLNSYVKAKIPEEDSEDLVQEVFTRLTDFAPELEQHASLRVLLFKIALSLIFQHRDRLRKSTKNTAHAHRSGVGFPSFDANRGELQLTLDDALRELPLRARYVVELRAFQGLSYTEIAEVLDITGATARSWHASALRQLQRKLNDRVDVPL
ncbi:MAG: sigma-70 family RNA polymerase sigma factor, partial [Enhygromyxa sp.]